MLFMVSRFGVARRDSGEVVDGLGATELEDDEVVDDALRLLDGAAAVVGAGVVVLGEDAVPGAFVVGAVVLLTGAVDEGSSPPQADKHIAATLTATSAA